MKIISGLVKIKISADCRPCLHICKVIMSTLDKCLIFYSFVIFLGFYYILYFVGILETKA